MNILKKIFSYAFSHKIITLIAIAFVVFGGYLGINSMSNKKVTPKYVVSTATKGTLITTISGTGQVATSNEVDVKAKVSGDITYVGASAGEDVSDGSVLMRIDSADAKQTVRDAETSLELAKLSLEELKAPADNLTILQAENSLISVDQSKENAQDDLEKAYDDGFTSISNAFLDLPGVLSGLNDVLYGDDFSQVQENANYYSGTASKYDEKIIEYASDASAKYTAARAAYDKNFSDYKLTSRYSSKETIEALVSETYDTTKTIAEAVKSANNLIQFYKDKLIEYNVKPNSIADTHLTSLNTYTSKTNSNLSSLLSIEQTINNDKKSIESTERTIAEKEASLKKIKDGATDLEIKTQELSVRQKENALLDAQKNLSYYTIYAPFSGTVAKVSYEKGDSVSSGSSLITFISKGRMVNVSLNEVDISKVNVGDAVTLTFDAISDVTLAGKVSEVETVGTVSSGVVYYNVEISFDDTTGLVKPGMSASASIITEAKQDVLMISSSAIKSSNGSYYVEVPSVSVDSSLLNNNKGVNISGSLTKKTIEIGSSNDSYTEVTSGLNENDQLIISTISGTSSSSTKKSTTTTTKTTTTNTGGSMMTLTGGEPPR